LFGASDSLHTSITVSAPNGSYKGIQFNIGLDSIQDAMQESSDPSSPLYNTDGMDNWGPGQGYVFAYVDGNVSPTPSGGFEYHVGTAPYYTSAPVLSKNFSIDGGNQTLILNATAQNLFYGSYSVNLNTQYYTETGGNNDSVAFAFMADFSHIFSLQ
jgi:hypothetical protein